MPKADTDPVKAKTSKKSADSPKATRTSNGIDIKALLEAGAHFGHKTSRWHPKMAAYIHSQREGSHIIDLTKTAESLALALDFLKDIAGSGKQILLVSTKRQAKDKVKEVAEATNMPYVTERWLGGMLTNQATIGGRIRHLKDLEARMQSGDLAARYSKLEVQRISDEIAEMNNLYGGIKNMEARPGALFVVDVLNDDIALREARKLGIPVVGLADTNVDPSQIDYPIPCNDDATKTINLILDYVKAAIEEGLTGAKKPAPSAQKEGKIEEQAEKPAKAQKEVE